MAFEDVDIFSISLDGKQLRTINVAEKLDALQYFSFDEKRFLWEQMEEFKTTTWQIRKEGGLSCVDD